MLLEAISVTVGIFGVAVAVWTTLDARKAQLQAQQKAEADEKRAQAAEERAKAAEERQQKAEAELANVKRRAEAPFFEAPFIPGTRPDPAKKEHQLHVVNKSGRQLRWAKFSGPDFAELSAFPNGKKDDWYITYKCPADIPVSTPFEVTVSFETVDGIKDTHRYQTRLLEQVFERIDPE